MVPDISEYQGSWSWIDRSTEVPVSLVRNDGIIYSTGLTFNYNVELGLRTRATAAALAAVPQALPEPEIAEMQWLQQQQQIQHSQFTM